MDVRPFAFCNRRTSRCTNIHGIDFYLILYSRLHHLVQGFRCPTSETDTFSAADAFLLDIPSTSEDSSDLHSARYDGQFLDLVFKEISDSTKSEKLHGRGVRPLKLFALDSQLALHESMYFGPGDDYLGEQDHTEGELLQTRRRHRRRRAPQSDFVVDDWDESVSGSDFLLAPNTRASTTTATPRGTLLATDFTSIYQVATGQLTVTSKGTSQEPQSEGGFSHLLLELENKISDRTLTISSTRKTM